MFSAFGLRWHVAFTRGGLKPANPLFKSKGLAGPTKVSRTFTYYFTA